MPNVRNAAGEVVFRGKSDAEAARWWRREGLADDWMDDTDELMSDVAANLGLDN